MKIIGQAPVISQWFFHTSHFARCRGRKVDLAMWTMSSHGGRWRTLGPSSLVAHVRSDTRPVARQLWKDGGATIRRTCGNVRPDALRTRATGMERGTTFHFVTRNEEALRLANSQRRQDERFPWYGGLSPTILP